MYSQDREEEFVTAFFGNRIERFLDVGAHDRPLQAARYQTPVWG